MKFPMDTDIYGGDLVGEPLVINILQGQQLIRFQGVDVPSADIGKNLNRHDIGPLGHPVSGWTAAVGRDNAGNIDPMITDAAEFTGIAINADRGAAQIGETGPADDPSLEIRMGELQPGIQHGYGPAAAGESIIPGLVGPHLFDRVDPGRAAQGIFFNVGHLGVAFQQGQGPLREFQGQIGDMLELFHHFERGGLPVFLTPFPGLGLFPFVDRQSPRPPLSGLPQ